MKRNLLYISFLFLLGSCSQNRNYKNNELIISDDFNEQLKIVYDWMADSRYDSAEVELLALYDIYENNYEEYIIHIYQAEIMYYNNFTAQGLESNSKALALAEKLMNDTLIGTCHNYSGLFELNEKNGEKALPHFKKALSYFPDPFLSVDLVSDYQLLANIAESFLLMGQADSVIKYTNKSLEKSIKYNRIRGTAINYWTLAEAYILKKQLDSAQKYIQLGVEEATNSPNKDVLLYTYEAGVKASFLQKNYTAMYNFIDKGLDENILNKATNISIISFYKTAVEKLIAINNSQRAVALLSALINFENNVRAQENDIKSKVLERYYENNKKLQLAAQENAIKEREIKLNRSINFVLLSIIFLTVLLFYLLYKQIKNKRLIDKILFEKKQEEIKIENEKAALIAKQKAIELERNRIAKELHDDIGSAISSISIYTDIALNTNSFNDAKAKELLNKISSNAKQISEGLSDLIWAIYTENNTLESLVQRMRQAAFELFTPCNISIDFEVKEASPKQTLDLTLKRNVYLFFKEAINNIIKHSACSKVLILISQTDNIISISISDNGNGYDTGQNLSGNGIRNMHAGAKSINGKLNITSVVNVGTHVTLQFPI